MLNVLIDVMKYPRVKKADAIGIFMKKKESIKYCKNGI